VLLAALVLPLRAGAQGAPFEPGHPLWLSPEKQANVANCVVNVGIATTFLGKAAVAINAAVLDCDGSSTDAACSVQVSGAVGSFGVTAAFISAAAAECRSSLAVVDEHAVLQEACAADISILVGALAFVASTASLVPETCPGAAGGVPLPPAPLPPRRRLQANDTVSPERSADPGGNRTAVWRKLEAAMHNLEKHGFLGKATLQKAAKGNGTRATQQVPQRTDLQNAACAFHVSQATFLLARAGLMINYAVKDCSRHVLFEGTDITQSKCIADVARVVGALGFTAGGIGLSVFECPTIIDNLDAACSAAIITMVGAVSELVASGASQVTSCAAMKGEEGAIESSVASPERRLTGAATPPASSSGGYLV